MPDNIVTVLDTTVADTGPDQTRTFPILHKDTPMRFSISLGSGDTVVIEGKAESADAYEVLHTFTDETPADVYVSHLWRARRSVDGTAGDSTVKVQNIYNEVITGHA
jgi:hypothetical protein